MTKKYKKHDKGPKTKIKFLEQQPLKFAGAICPLNLEEQKERFLKHGKLPRFVLKGSEDEIEQLYNKARNQIRFELFGEAEYILKTVKEKFGDGEKYMNKQYGDKITKERANEILQEYIKDNNLDGAMSIIWCNDMASSARMMWVGPNVKNNRPEARDFSFWIKNSSDNMFISEHGIRCLANHEIGTHFFRAFNDGLQPWYSDRKRFGIKGMSCIEHMRAEEGLAAINTILDAKERFLWGPAILYYTACKASGMSFKQLFDHLGTFISSPEQRWKYCMRVKRGLVDPNDIGGYGKDQCYFEGAVEILRNIDNIDFNVLMSGKICPDEIPRCKRVARLDCLRMPSFMKNEKKYKKQLQAIASLNGLHEVHPKSSPPAAYIQRLKRGRRIGPASSSGKVRKKGKRGLKSFLRGSSLSSSNESEVSESDVESSKHSVVNAQFNVHHQNPMSENTIPSKSPENSENDIRVDSGIVSDMGCHSGSEALEKTTFEKQQTLDDEDDNDDNLSNGDNADFYTPIQSFDYSRSGTQLSMASNISNEKIITSNTESKKSEIVQTAKSKDCSVVSNPSEASSPELSKYSVRLTSVTTPELSPANTQKSNFLSSREDDNAVRPTKTVLGINSCSRSRSDLNVLRSGLPPLSTYLTKSVSEVQPSLPSKLGSAPCLTYITGISSKLKPSLQSTKSAVEIAEAQNLMYNKTKDPFPPVKKLYESSSGMSLSDVKDQSLGNLGSRSASTVSNGSVGNISQYSINSQLSGTYSVNSLTQYLARTRPGYKDLQLTEPNCQWSPTGCSMDISTTIVVDDDVENQQPRSKSSKLAEYQVADNTCGGRRSDWDPMNNGYSSDSDKDAGLVPGHRLKSRQEAGLTPPYKFGKVKDAGLVPPPCRGSKLSWRSSLFKRMCDKSRGEISTYS